jgi:hypothetical protein
MNDLQFAGRYLCPAIRCPGRLIILQKNTYIKGFYPFLKYFLKFSKSKHYASASPKFHNYTESDISVRYIRVLYNEGLLCLQEDIKMADHSGRAA